MTSETNEPTVPTIDFSEPKQRPEFSRGRDISRPDEFKPPQRQGQRENADRAAWEKDLEERRNRPLPVRPQPTTVDVVTELDAELAKLETAAQVFERDFGKPNEPLLAAKQLVADLEAKLATAKQELAVIEAKGDSVSRLRTAIQWAESALLGLHGASAQEIIDSLVAERLGPGVPAERVPPHLRDEFKLNSRVRGLQALRPMRSIVSQAQISKEELLKALDIAGESLIAIRNYVVADREQNAKQ
jgi:hypothetical protein